MFKHDLNKFSRLKTKEKGENTKKQIKTTATKNKDITA